MAEALISLPALLCSTANATISAGARERGLTQGAVARQVAQLEELFGVR